MKQQKALAIMAAGMGSRFGSLKQLHYITSNNYSIIDFSIYDAISAGFNTIVFIVRDEILEDFKIRYENRLDDSITMHFIIQDINDIPGHHKSELDRKKPWGTGHALLSLENVIENNFALINADDFYGKDAFKTMHDALFNAKSTDNNFFIGYPLKNTLSNNGTVSRGECIMDDKGFLMDIHERGEIKMQSNGIIDYTLSDKEKGTLLPETTVSMNFWGLSPRIFDVAKIQFDNFLENLSKNDNTSEFYITTIVDHTIKNGLMNCKMLSTKSQWYGITYKSDIDEVSNKISDFVSQDIYPEILW